MMSGELIYSNLIFSETQKQSPAKEDDISKAVTEREEDVTYSDIRTGANLQVHAGKAGIPDSVTQQAKEDLLSKQLQIYKLNVTGTNELLGNVTAMLSRERLNYQKNLTEVNQLLANVTAKQCAIGWESYNGSCYNLYEDKLTWEQSQYACIHEGGHLVIIESLQEQEFIRMKVGNTNVGNTNMGNNYWIGMTDMETEGVWVWMDNTTLNDSIKFWDLNNGTDADKYPEPNNWEGKEHCAQMGRRCSNQTSCWLDLDCKTPSKRICESRSIK
ncbi:hypothetical protein DPEC_G00095150 [Dallia pectoralis]|uniref:Uncharacterized protein n=1 Tax=Dallia pectoralis TaxID=75939 RepID=A0ACC2GUT7_DALPE|nr:hypothetical protein DPEC_G00095150 [Dallia pectoralis]